MNKKQRAGQDFALLMIQEKMGEKAASMSVDWWLLIIAMAGGRPSLFGREDGWVAVVSFDHVDAKGKKWVRSCLQNGATPSRALQRAAREWIVKGKKK